MKTHVSGTQTYWVWSGMKQRCLNPKSVNYKRYGAKGITVCEQWAAKKGYQQFIEDMGERPIGMTLDRVDSKGNYEPDNCRWATTQQQSLNKSYNKPLSTSGHRGVRWDQKAHKWAAFIGEQYLGLYEELEDAVKVRVTIHGALL